MNILQEAVQSAFKAACERLHEINPDYTGSTVYHEQGHWGLHYKTGAVSCSIQWRSLHMIAFGFRDSLVEIVVPGDYPREAKIVIDPSEPGLVDRLVAETLRTQMARTVDRVEKQKNAGSKRKRTKAKR